MPNLINVYNFRIGHNANKPKLDPCMYFSNAYLGMNNEYKFTIEDDYPYVATIHIEVLEDPRQESTRKFWIDLRKWVERSCTGDVLYKYERLDYSWWWNRDAKREWDKAYSQVKHGYWHFYFEVESDFTMFALMHGDKFTKVEKYHPNFGKDVTEQDKIYGKVT